MIDNLSIAFHISTTNNKQHSFLSVIRSESNVLPILLCQNSIHSWKDSSQKSLSSVVMALLMVPCFQNDVCDEPFLAWGKEKYHTAKDQKNSEVILLWRYSYRLRTTKWSVQLVPLLFRLAQIVGDNIPLTFLTFSWLAIIPNVNRRLPHITCLTRLTLISVQHVEGLSLRESSFSSSRTYLNLLYHSKAHVHNMVLSPYTSLSFSSVCDGD